MEKMERPTMKELPTQSEIDAIAHFVEAIRELKNSPYFTEEHKSLSISWSEKSTKDQICGKFPDINVVKAALIPFRRVWLQSEPCNYARVTNILRRFEPECELFLAPILFEEKNSITRGMYWLKDCELSSSEVVNLWLNTRYHHVGKGKAGQYTRADFERYQEKLGPVILEFYFLLTIHEIGISFFNIEICASRFLKALAEKGYTPSFPLGHAKNINIKRSTPGFTPEPDSLQQRVWKLRRRRHYDGVNEFFSLSELSDARLAELLSHCETFNEFSKLCRFEFEHTERFDEDARNDDSIVKITGCIDNRFIFVNNSGCRCGFIAKRSGKPFLIGESYLLIVGDQYAEFRNALLQEPFQ